MQIVFMSAMRDVVTHRGNQSLEYPPRPQQKHKTGKLINPAMLEKQ